MSLLTVYLWLVVGELKLAYINAVEVSLDSAVRLWESPQPVKLGLLKRGLWSL